MIVHYVYEEVILMKLGFFYTFIRTILSKKVRCFVDQNSCMKVFRHDQMDLIIEPAAYYYIHMPVFVKYYFYSYRERSRSFPTYVRKQTQKQPDVFCVTTRKI